MQSHSQTSATINQRAYSTPEALAKHKRAVDMLNGYIADLREAIASCPRSYSFLARDYLRRCEFALEQMTVGDAGFYLGEYGPNGYGPGIAASIKGCRSYASRDGEAV